MFIISRLLKGRHIIYTDKNEVNESNLVEILGKAKSIHDVNCADIEYLYNYYKGVQDILQKKKEVRTEINNKITENRAWEIVSFKKGYTFGEPVQYIARGEDENITKQIDELNDIMVECDKDSLDSELAEWFFVGGVGYRICLPNPNYGDDEPPLKIYTLDPRSTFIVRYDNLAKDIAMAVTYKKVDNHLVYSIYTKDMFYIYDELDGIVTSEPIYIDIPIIEYVNNNARIGAFEPVVPLLDAINSVQSNRLDDIEQHVNSFMAVYGAEITKETYEQIQEWKMLILPEGADVKYLSAPLSQTDVQTYVDSMYQTILTICGMPSVESGGNGGDNGVAVHLRNGWETAETQAKSIEKVFKKSERDLLKLALRILKNFGLVDLKLRNIDIKFARRYTDNILTKVQSLTTLLDAGISPSIAIATSGIWNDPNDVYIQSKKTLEKWNVEIDEEPINYEDDGDNPVDVL